MIERRRQTLIRAVGNKSLVSHRQLYEMLIDPKDARPNLLGKYSSIGIPLEKLKCVSVRVDDKGKKIADYELYNYKINQMMMVIISVVNILKE